MPRTRRLQGEIAFPGTAQTGVAAKIIIELRDVSLQDQASTVVAATTLDSVPISPNCRVPFELQAAPGADGRAFAMRVQVDMQLGLRHASGDFLSTVAQPVPAEGDVSGLVVPVTQL